MNKMIILSQMQFIHAKKKKSQKNVSSLDEFYTIITYTYLGIFLPMVLIFVYHTVKDPAFPILCKTCAKYVKHKLLSMFGKRLSVSSKEENDPSNIQVHDVNTRKQEVRRRRV